MFSHPVQYFTFHFGKGLIMMLHGSYRQGLVKFKDFSRTVWPIFKDYSLTKYLHFYFCAITGKVQLIF